MHFKKSPASSLSKGREITDTMPDDLNPSETIRLLRSAAQGNETGWVQLQERHRKRLHRLVSVRLDNRMRARVDASDVVQDAFIEAWEKLDAYIEQPKMPFYLWLRSITGHKLMSLHRYHLGAAKRAAGREVSIYNGGMPETTNAGLAEQLAGEYTNASDAAMHDELVLELQKALAKLDPIDCEILTLRHFEQLTNSEIAMVLKIKASATSKRYIRALRKMKQIVSTASGEVD